jgi:D-cysteine desulfhydrase
VWYKFFNVSSIAGPCPVIFDAVDGFARAKLLSDPTPIEHLENLSDHLGLDLWIKRDDLTGLGFGGNKVRQLEFYFGAAQKAAADTVLITGAVQSNYVRTAAAAAAKLGMKAVLQLEDRVSDMDQTYATSGNVLLGQILGAEFMRYGNGEDETGADKALRARADALRAAGRTPYVIPLGLNNPPIGALGYMDATREIHGQAAGFDAVVVASGSGMTHMGLLAGLRVLGLDMPVYGSCVRRAAGLQAARLNTLKQNLAEMLQCDLPVTVDDIRVWDGALGPSYGKLGKRAHAALKLMSTREGLFLDPVYTAKSFAAVTGLLNEGVLTRGQRVLFVHTGGTPALFAYQNTLGAG